MEDMQELKKKIDHLEYDEINPLKEDVTNIKISLSNTSLLTSQAIESNKKLSEAMESFKETMISIAQSVKDANVISSQLADTVDKLNEKISIIERETKKSIEGVNTKLCEIDDKSKVDILDWLKRNWFGVIGLGGIVYTLIQAILTK